MSFIEVLAIISDFYFVFIVTASLIGVVVYLIRDIFRGKVDESILEYYILSYSELSELKKKYKEGE